MVLAQRAREEPVHPRRGARRVERRAVELHRIVVELERLLDSLGIQMESRPLRGIEAIGFKRGERDAVPSVLIHSKLDRFGAEQVDGLRRRHRGGRLRRGRVGWINDQRLRFRRLRERLQQRRGLFRGRRARAAILCDDGAKQRTVAAQIALLDPVARACTARSYPTMSRRARPAATAADRRARPNRRSNRAR